MSQGFTPANVTAGTGLHQRITSAAVAVTATSTGTLSGPIGFQYAWAVVSNSSPWIMSATGSDGTRTILPYSADLVVPSSAGVTYTMSAPPGSTIAGTGQNPYVQADWYVLGSPQPPGAFPYSLTTQAITAAIAAQASQTVVVASLGAFGYNFVSAGRLAEARFVLTTSAAAGSRQLSMILIDPNTAVIYKAGASATQGPTLTGQYYFFEGAPFTSSTPTGEPLQCFIPFPNIAVGVGWNIAAEIINKDVADTVSLDLVLSGS